MMYYTMLATTEMIDKQLTFKEIGDWDSGQSRLSPISKSHPPPKSPHSVERERIYSVWSNMIRRCHNPAYIGYKNYGERGIIVCSEWRESFDVFYFWALRNGYNKDLQIDRMDNNRGYMPGNCRWTTSLVNCNNKNNNIRVIISNKSYTLSQLAREYNINDWVLRKRYKAGDRGDRLIRPKRDKIKRKRVECKCGCGETFLTPKYRDKKFVLGHSAAWKVYGERKD